MNVIPKLTPKEIVRFWARVTKQDGCWSWTTKSDKPYGFFGLTREGKTQQYLAHRVALFLYTGVQADVARHSCDNPNCCNPNHLSWGTQQDNMEDRKERTGFPTGSSHHRAKLTESDVLAIRDKFGSGQHSKSMLAKEFGVSYNTIDNIIHRRKWTHI